jgi:hypothetical protein
VFVPHPCDFGAKSHAPKGEPGTVTVSARTANGDETLGIHAVVLVTEHFAPIRAMRVAPSCSNF